MYSILSSLALGASGMYCCEKEMQLEVGKKWFFSLGIVLLAIAVLVVLCGGT